MYIIVPKQVCQRTRELLVEIECLDTRREFIVSETLGEGNIGLPLKFAADDKEEELRLKRFLERKLTGTIDDPASKIFFSRLEECDAAAAAADAKKKTSRRHLLVGHCTELMKSLDLWIDKLEDEIPRHWDKHRDLILLPNDCFQHPNWHHPSVGSSLWRLLCQFLKATRVARKSRVQADDFRSPRVQLLHDEASEDLSNTWVSHVDNGIEYSWDVTRSMFSAGNISEKLRLAALDCRGETVVDLFAGIGYFTLPYLVHARADLVHACEWNPASVEALRRNLRLNGIAPERCVVHEGDNRESCPVGVADRVNLGLIPTSEMSYAAACKALKPDKGGILHIHGNVDRSESATEEVAAAAAAAAGRGNDGFKCKYPAWEKWSLDTVEKIAQYLKEDGSYLQRQWKVEPKLLTRVKSYAPKVDHLVLDLQCIPG